MVEGHPPHPRHRFDSRKDRKDAKSAKKQNEGKATMVRTDYWNSKNPDIRGSMAAMRRAAALARQIAIETDTGIVVVRNGKIVHVSAAELREGKE